MFPDLAGPCQGRPLPDRLPPARPNPPPDLREPGYRWRTVVEPASDWFFSPRRTVRPLTSSPLPLIGMWAHTHSVVSMAARVVPHPWAVLGRPTRMTARPRSRPRSVWAEIPLAHLTNNSLYFPFSFSFSHFHTYSHILVFYAAKMIQTLYESHKMIALRT
jgi:hypothetical protein